MDALIAGYLRDGVQESGLTYRQIAAKTGMSINRLGIILRQEPPPATVGEIGLIASTFNANVAALVERAELALSSRDEYGLVANDSIDESFDVPDSEFDGA